MPASSSPISTSSKATTTKLKDHTQSTKEGQSSKKRRIFNVAAGAASSQDVLLFLVAFRILNALCIKTFFQPDEYFQSLEPAWHMVFGGDSGAWITWEWRSELRSAIHPAMFAAVYYIANLVIGLLRLAPATSAEVLLVAPKILQGVCAGLGDYYTWRLGQRLFGQRNDHAWATLALTVLSPWQWFCSTRTLSNCLETTLTVVAMYNWPWHWSRPDRVGAEVDDAGLRVLEETDWDFVDETTRLRRALLPAALATVLRPTNLLIWMTLTVTTCFRLPTRISPSDSVQRGNSRLPFRSFVRVSSRELIKLFTESLLCGSTVLVCSVLVDRLYYQSWTFPPIRFIYLNVVQSLSVFYGINDWHYYLSQGLPLLLTTALPFTLIGIYRRFLSAGNSEASESDTALRQFATVACVVFASLSLISHKEVRFIYPLLPLLHLLAVEPLCRFFADSVILPLRTARSPSLSLYKRLLLGLLLLTNASIGIYSSGVHNRGLIDVLTYLRHQHESHYLPDPPAKLTAAFLMPCHSTPWRSHLIYQSISAWALTCEPPVALSEEAKADYLDEADHFYADPIKWLTYKMSRQMPQAGRPDNLITSPGSRGRDGSKHQQGDSQSMNDDQRRDWPDYLIFFAQAEQTMEVALHATGYSECWRGFNSHWHDDWRRTGDVVVWCLFPGTMDRAHD